MSTRTVLVTLNGDDHVVKEVVFKTDGQTRLRSFILLTNHGPKRFTFRNENEMEEQSTVASMISSNNINIWQRYYEIINDINTQTVQAMPTHGLLIVMYQDARSLSNTIHNLKEAVIDPLSTHFHFGLVMSLATDGGGTARAIATQSLIFNMMDKYDLTEYLLLFKVHHPSALRRITAEFERVLAQTNSSEWNPAIGLFSQIAQRHFAARLALQFLDDTVNAPPDRTFDFVAFLRSDVSYGHLELAQLLTFRDPEREAVVWVPNGADFDGVNDRIAFFTKFAFLNYAERIVNETIKFMIRSKIVHGEQMHKAILDSVPILIHRVNMCYGMFRSHLCSWENYGVNECREMAKAHPSSSYNKRMYCNRRDQN